MREVTENQYKYLMLTVAHDIYSILFTHCGAPESQRDSFVYHFCKSNPRRMTEFRFQGSLGFGGKFWRSSRKYYVNCYTEHETPARLEQIEKTNNMLAGLCKAVDYL